MSGGYRLTAAHTAAQMPLLKQNFHYIRAPDFPSHRSGKTGMIFILIEPLGFCNADVELRLLFSLCLPARAPAPLGVRGTGRWLPLFVFAAR